MFAAIVYLYINRIQNRVLVLALQEISLETNFVHIYFLQGIKRKLTFKNVFSESHEASRIYVGHSLLLNR